MQIRSPEFASAPHEGRIVRTLNTLENPRYGPTGKLVVPVHADDGMHVRHQLILVEAVMLGGRTIFQRIHRVEVLADFLL